MNITTVTAPTETAVSLEEAKEQVVVDDSSHDLALARLAEAAERMAERYLRGYISQRTVDLTLPHFPDVHKLWLVTFPIQSITSVSYIDENGDTQTLSEGDDYREQLLGKTAHLIAVNGWPATQEDTPNAVTVRMVVGYASGAVPQDIKHAILVKVSELFEVRTEAVMGGSLSPSMNTFKSLLNTYRRYG